MNCFLKKRKWMAWVILLTFLFTSFMPTNLLAGNSRAEAATALGQIVSNGETIKYMGTGKGTLENPAIANPVTSGSWQASTSKTIAQAKDASGQSVENEFDITLQVKTNENLETYQVPQDAAVVIVLDTSSSMRRNSAGNLTIKDEDRRITKAVNAANTFISKYKNGITGKAYLSVVTFNSNATLNQDWIDLKESAYTLQTGTNSGTNIYAGLEMARTQLREDPIQDIKNKYVILLTDGSPNKGGFGYKQYTDTNGWKHDSDKVAAESSATNIKTSEQATLYTLGYGTGRATDNELSGSRWLSEFVATPGCHRDASNGEDVDVTLSDIYEEIRLLSSAWEVSDKMRKPIHFLGFYNRQGGLIENKVGVSANGKEYCTYDASEKKINWNLRITPVDSGTENPYSFTLKYRVRLDNTFDEFREYFKENDQAEAVGQYPTNDEQYPTDRDVKLVYVIQNGETKELTAGPFEVAFEVPFVKGFLGKVNGDADIRFVKVDADDHNTKLSGAEFELKLADGHADSHADDSRYAIGVSATSSSEEGKEGTFSFSDIPSGHTYILTEEEPPVDENGISYTKSTWTVEVNYGEVTVKDEKGNAVEQQADGKFIIGNTKPTKQIEVKKVWQNPENFAPAATLELLQDGDPFELSPLLPATALPQGVTVEADGNGQKHTYVNLPAQNDGTISDQTVSLIVPNDHKYTVREVITDADGTHYVTDSEGAESTEVTLDGKKWNASVNGLTATNTYIGSTIAQETITISGKKLWKVPEELKATVVPNQIEVQLFRDGDVYVGTTTASAADWAYTFDNLPRYAVGEAVGENEEADGHAYVYRVKEVPVDGFTSEVVKVAENTFNIINTYDRSDRIASISVTKVWDDFDTNVSEHPAVTAQLYQNDILYDTVQLSDANDWQAAFTDLPKYDVNQNLYQYKVQEVPVNGYVSEVTGSVADGFVITNTLLLAKPGEVAVSKVATGDNKPDANTSYNFELQIQVRPGTSNVLFEASALSDLTLSEAAEDLNEAIGAVEESAILVTSSTQYQYFLTEKADAFATEAQALMAVAYHHTSPSAIVFEQGQGPGVPQRELDENDSDYFLSLRNNVVKALVKLSESYSVAQIGDLLVALSKEIPLDEAYGYAMAMDQVAVENLIAAAQAYAAVAGDQDVPASSETPLALQVFMKDSKTPYELTLVENAEVGDYYKADFSLASGASAVFQMQAASGSEIYYRIVENLDDTTRENYRYTNIFDAFTGQTTSGTAIDFTLFDTDAAMAYTVTNVYTNNTSGEEPRPIIPSGGDDDSYDGPYSDETIDGPNVPLAEPEVPIEEPIEIDDVDVPFSEVSGEPIEIEAQQVPLGNAPQTGDSNNAVPFVVLMLLAAAGLTVTRRKFN